MSRQPTRQLSLQRPTKRAQVRRQRSADDNQPVKTRRDKTSWGSMERPKVRIAWGSQAEDTSKVEIIASRIGTINRNPKGNTFPASPVISTDKTAILYSRQELAERLRLAWKQREANKSNIDIFLAHDIAVEERCDSRLSTSSCLDSKAVDDERDDKAVQFNERKSELENCAPESQGDRSRSKIMSNEKEVKVNLIPDARAKRASFQSGSNLAFTGPVQKSTLVSPIIKDARDRSGPAETRGKRTNSAPPLQRRTPLLSPANLPNLSNNRPRVNIIIDTPKIAKPREFSAPFKFERKDWINHRSSSPSSHQEEKNQVTPVMTIPTEKVKLTGNKRRARSGKRRLDDTGRKSELSKNNNPDVVTMVSLVSDADSDSEVEKNNSPRDDKLVRQLRNNLATTPIIKNSSTLLVNVGNLHNDSSNTLMPRRVLKSVSFQQDSIDGELHLRPTSTERKSCEPKATMEQSAQLIRSLAEEMGTAWQPITCTNVQIPDPPSSSNYWEESQEVSSLTEREKRCLVVPIGDQQQDKKRILLQRTKSVPAKADSSEECSTSALQLMEEPKAKFSAGKSEEQGEGVSIESSITKLIDGDSFRIASVDVEVDIQAVEPHLKTTKEKECWHLYRRMCDKGVCVSFDTVLRGMLTPTEYRLRKREAT